MSCIWLAAQGHFNFMTDSSIEMRDRVASGGLDGGGSAASFGAPIAPPEQQHKVGAEHPMGPPPRYVPVSLFMVVSLRRDSSAETELTLISLLFPGRKLSSCAAHFTFLGHKVGILSLGRKSKPLLMLLCEQGQDAGGVGSADVQQSVAPPVEASLGVLATEPTPAPTANGIHGGEAPPPQQNGVQGGGGGRGGGYVDRGCAEPCSQAPVHRILCSATIISAAAPSAQHQAASGGLVWSLLLFPLVYKLGSNTRRRCIGDTCPAVVRFRSRGPAPWCANLAADRSWLEQGAVPSNETVAARHV